MYRIRTCRYRDGKPYIRVELPPLSEPQLYILESVVDAIWSVVAPQAGPTFVWLPAQLQPKFLIHDNDGKFGQLGRPLEWSGQAKGCRVDPHTMRGCGV